MGSSNLSNQVVFDPIRSCWVAATPEEQVRQRCIQQMIGPLGFPRGFLVVEKPLKDLVHLQGMAVPDRRLDLLCYAKGIHPVHLLYPLLLVECKAQNLTQAGIDQLLGYNHHVGAPFVAAVSSKEVQFVYKREGVYQCCSFLPTFKELIAWLTS